MGTAKPLAMMTDAAGHEFVLVPRREYERMAGDKPLPGGVPPGSVDAVECAMQSLAAKLRTARLDARLSQMELAARVRKTQSFVSQVESGRTRPTETYVARVLEACRTAPPPHATSTRHKQVAAEK